MSKFIDLTGQVFGRWTIIGRHSVKPFRCGTATINWACRCECGTEKVVQGSNLRSGHSRSCGCLLIDTVTTHGATNGGKPTPEYAIWMGMRGRCRVISSGGYKHYGARGILVCDRWNDFENFLADMGKRPSSKHSVERIDNNGNYEPRNCRWATNTEQQLNKRTTRNSLIGVSGIRHDSASGNWDAQISIHGKALSLGAFATRAEAAIARVAAERVRDAMLDSTRHRLKTAAKHAA